MKRKILSICLVIGLLITLSACTDVKPEKVSNNAATSSNSSNKSSDTSNTGTSGTEVFKVGDTVKAGDATFMVNGVRKSSGSEFFQPKDGNTYYIVDVTVENKGSDSLAVSSLLMFKLIDSDNYSYDIAMVPDLKGSMDGEVSAGRKLRGEVGFEVPKTVKGLELEIDPSVWGNGKVVFKLQS